MNQRTSISSILLMGLASGAAVTTAVAQDDRAGSVEEIIVTARRVEERLQDVPISISVLTDEQLSNRNIITAGDLGTYVPSLATNSRFGPESTSFAIRGFTQESQTAPSVAVYFADVTAPRGQGGTTGGNGAGVGAFFDLQNVQVLRGPQGTLFGRNTTGGAVLLVPNKPTSEFEGYAEVSAGNYDMQRFQGVVNVPFSDRVRFRLGGDIQKREGYLDNKSGIGPDDFNDLDYWAVRASLVVDITPNLENYSILSLSDSDTHGFYPSLRICNPSASGGSAAVLGPLACQQLARQEARGDDFYDIENGNPNPRQHIRQRQIINTTTWQATDTLTVKNIASYAEFKQGQTANIFGDNFTFLGQPFTYVQLHKDVGRDNISQWTATEEIQLQGRSFEDALTWQGGLYFEKSGPLDGFQGTNSPILLSCTDVSNLICTDLLGALAGRPAGLVQQSLTEYRFRNLGLYMQGTYELTEKFSITAGARYTADRTEGKGRVRTFLFPTPNTPLPLCSRNPDPTNPALTPEACEVEFVQKSEKPTWMIDLEYKPTDAAMLYVKYARGYRQGGVNTSNNAFETWKPEKVDTYEIGTKTSFYGPVSGTFNLAAFYNDFTDQQLAASATPADPTTSPAQGIVNAGKSRIRGVEVDASLMPLDLLRFDLSYAYLDTKLKSFNPPPFDTTRFAFLRATAEVGGDLTLAPKHRVSLAGTLTLPVPEHLGLVTFGATYTYTAKQVASADSPIGQLPSTDLVNLNLNWSGIAGTPLDLSLFATNVTDEEYYTFVGGSWNSAGFDTAIVGLPRMYGARVRYSFGR